MDLTGQAFELYTDVPGPDEATEDVSKDFIQQRGDRHFLMPIETICPGCRRKLRVGDEFAGNQARCPVCNEIYSVAVVAESLGKTQNEKTWRLKTPEGQVYGPVLKEELDKWVTDGRVTAECQLASDEANWDRADVVYPVLKEVQTATRIPFGTGAIESPVTSVPPRPVELLIAPQLANPKERDRNAIIVFSGVSVSLVALTILAVFTSSAHPNKARQANRPVIANPSPLDKHRQWTDNTGNFSVHAKLASRTDEFVVLLKENGRRSTVPMRRLSKADRDYLISLDEREDTTNIKTETGDPEEAMFALVSEEAVYHVLSNVDRFHAEFEKPRVLIPHDDPTIANVAVYCTFNENGRQVKRLFFVILENNKSPNRASSKEDLTLLLLNADGKVVQRDEDFWDGLAIDVQTNAGAVDTNGPPFAAMMLFEFERHKSGRVGHGL